MATPFVSDKPDAASANGDGSDPFTTSTPGPSHLRHSAFDTELFALAPGASVEQVKRALEAHLRDTERRMEEAGKLGTALVQQQKQLTEKLRELEQLQSEDELTPQLRQRLVEIEKDYNEVARESARALLPKQRVPSNESQGSPFSPEGKVSRRSVSPAKFESLAAPSPTKFISNRKIRNQHSSRIHDIEFAAEISTHLIAQVRELQATLAAREEELKEAKAEKARLEIEAEAFQQRLKSLDESESRYKDENWNLETQIHDLLAAQKAAAEREKKLIQSLNLLQAEKNATQRELEELKDNLAKQDEKHSAQIKNLEIELGTSRRTAAMFETERASLQKKLDDLTSQNQELARAFAALQRDRAQEREANQGAGEEDLHPAPDHNTPEHSPPPSPMKPTPRHSALESETLKTSLAHAQRTIQTLRTNIHREKTEKLELKRMLQEARDEIEKLRNDPNPHQPPKKARKFEPRELKKSSFRLNQLGVARSSRTEVVEDDDWEDQSESPSPHTLSRRGSFFRFGTPTAPRKVRLDQFDTAPETSDAAFETAHERATETEDFQTGAEELSDDNDATETEAGQARGADSIKRPPPLPPHESSNHYSFRSTVSTSSEDDEDEYPSSPELKTPTTGPRMRMRSSRTSLTRARQFSEDSNQSFSASPPAHGSSVTPGGQSLFAELNSVDNSDEDSCGGAATPSRRSIRSSVPATPRSVGHGRVSPTPEVPTLPRVIMVDSSTMTDPVDIRPVSADAQALRESDDSEALISSPPSIVCPDSDRPISRASVAGSRPVGAPTTWLGDDLKAGDPERPHSSASYSDASAQHDWHFPSSSLSSSLVGAVPPPALSISSIQTECIEPQPEHEVAPSPLLLAVSSIMSAEIVPVMEQEERPVLSIIPTIFEQVEPAAEPEPVVPKPPTLSIPALVTQDICPIAPSPPALSFSEVHTEQIEPDAEPDSTTDSAIALSISSIRSEQVEPVLEPEPVSVSPVSLSLSAICFEHVEPIESLAAHSEPPLEHQVQVASASVPLTFSPLISELVEPQEDVPTSPIKLSLSAVKTEDVEPQMETPATPVRLSFSTIQAEEVEPTQEPEAAVPSLAFASIHSVDVSPRETPAPQLGVSPIQTWSVEPIEEPGVSPPVLTISAIEAQEIQPAQLEESGHTPELTFSEIQILHTEPRSPKRNAFIIPRDTEGDTVLPQPVPWSPEPESMARQIRSIPTADQGAQTTLTSEAIDQLLRAKMPPSEAAEFEGANSVGMQNTPSTVKVHRPPQGVIETPLAYKGKQPDYNYLTEVLEPQFTRRPGSSASRTTSFDDVPPLPSNHREVIEAVRSGSSHGGQGTIGSMGPPPYPASLKPQSQPLRPRTPTNSRRPVSPVLYASVSGRGTPTPRPAPKYGAADVHSLSKATTRSRKSSISSFTSEVDTRFNMHHDAGFESLGSGTDPRMIQAITQTMIGEYLWKYTRKKTGRGEMSENRHRRYFWVHPYTRTLYWSTRDPSTAGRSELRAKSVQIEAVRVVNDDNPFPPGLHQKSLIIVSPGRSIKFTCTTGQRHETWFNALSYLLLRTANEGQSDAEEIAGNITREDVDEFNPAYPRRYPRAVPSVSSYSSRTVREPPNADISLSVPTLTQSRPKAPAPGRSSFATLGRISGYWKDSKLSGTFGSIRSRSVPGRDPVHGIFDAPEAHDSAEDVRQMIERQDREADRIENVRACCDGKHDVGTLSNSAKKGRNSVAGFRTPTPGPSATPTPAGTIRS
ncbi:uncharacterized protein CTHT_0011800 [Thermochaetoides thermophila DSM 1495]|uniref:PH domain-containing protein n=1 Tax=Chaetomium thermophilum (strain DSM 1495 / CBS 144.50 / IMI 039719) TaxID=759272 RepID=G0S0Z6_CHATD|nr:hypothetical protein CTHT_0011800 [Thermochaetoides thermophila DSM 1495]EGS22706.1 hypothetical protein CTHT_0011800 [Thermochaetoides thermophila DSM 1495]